MNSLGFSSAVCLGTLLLCVSCRLPGKPTAAEVELKPEQVRDFAILYSQNCAGCHGQDGQGSAALGLANPIYLAIASDDTIRRVTAHGIPGTLMPAFAKSSGGTLTDEQIEVLVREMRARWARPLEKLDATPPPYSCNRTRRPDSRRDCLWHFLRRLPRTGGQRRVARRLHC